MNTVQHICILTLLPPQPVGIVQRKEREKTERREAILAAQRLFNEQGFEKVSMRNIAEAIEYRTYNIYIYFNDKNELLYTLQHPGVWAVATVV